MLSSALLRALPILPAPILLAPILLTMGCGREAGRADTAGAPASGAHGPADVHFAVRGRWDDPRALRYAVEATEGPVAADAFRRAIERAAAVWTATGVVRLVPADEAGKADEAGGAAREADVVLGWRRGRHGACEPFGIGNDVAHAGPVGTRTFVHFDAARTWSEDGGADRAPGGHSVFHTALHELGHVLGLGHSTAKDAVMNTEVERPGRLSRSDLAGLYSLYGGGQDRPGDLLVRDVEGAPCAALRAVAPPGRAEFTVFDTDGDGDDEVLVWRTDPRGHGALMIYHFGAGPRLERTHGPHLGMAATGADNVALVLDGQRLLVGLYPGNTLIRRFDEYGLLVPAEPTGLPPHLVEAARARVSPPSGVRGDLDGDGREETVVAVAAGT